ncbi:MAG TPA: TonB-dependent receptor, partial [Bacteroidetes bacterium]|nr:TonB-dependent receptor [Bacteroidota bacterium]
MKKSFFPFVFFLLCSLFAFGQQLTLSGIVQSSGSTPVSGIRVSASGVETTTDEDGFFRLNLPATDKFFHIEITDGQGQTIVKTVKPKGQHRISLGVIYLTGTDEEAGETENGQPTAKDLITGEDRIPIITLSSGEDESEQGPQNISGILSASRDPFIAAAAYNLSTGGFDIRGYRNETVVLMNGMPFNNIENGAIYWSSWGGLNDVTRNRQSAIDLGATSGTFGGIGGYTLFDTRASKQRPGKRISYMYSNRSYSGRLMGTWSTGMMDSGWAVTVSGSRRWAEEGYVPGTFYNLWSGFTSIDRKLDNGHLLNLTAFTVAGSRGSQGSSIQLANDLAGTNFYNPNWGWQNGKKRNARVTRTNQPVVILRHDWQLNEKSTLSTSIGHQFGRYGRTGLDWYNAPDPRPDYYRRLPLFLALENPDIAEQVTEIYSNNPDLLQIQWHDIYAGNVNNGRQYREVPGNWSQVILSDNRSDTRRLNGSGTFESIVNDHVIINAGLTFQREKTHYFKTVDDLLGGDYYINLNRFAPAPGLELYDINNPNPVVREGDTHGWDYDINGQKTAVWLQGRFSFKKTDFFVAGKMTATEFWRTGYMRSAIFPDNSFGSSQKQQYVNYGAKAGITYKIDGRNYFYSNASALNRAPDPRIAYASPRNRHQLVPGLTEEQVLAWEIGYQHRSPGLKARATYFHTQINDGLKLNRFFLPGDVSNFGTYILNGLDEKHAGIEVAFQAKITPTLSANGAASLSENIYTSRPQGFFVIDDDGRINNRGTIYIKNFFVPGTPQTAVSFGLDYRSPKFWSLSATVNYFNHNYIDFSPERRTADAVFGLEQDSPFYKQIVNQQSIPSAWTVDLFGYKSYRIKRNMFFSFTGGVTNLLNATVIQGGFEQLRFERADVEATGINVF